MSDITGSDVHARLAALETDNARLRTWLAEAEARAAESGHGFLLRDALAARLTAHSPAGTPSCPAA